MNKARKKRLQTVTQQIDAMPIAPAVEEAAFERFRETGELPEHRRLAEAVVNRVSQGRATSRNTRPRSWEENFELLAKMARGEMDSETRLGRCRRRRLDLA